MVLEFFYFFLNTSLYIIIWSNKTMVNLWLPWLQEPWFFFGFIRVKTMANFRKWTWKLGENIRCIGGGELITDIKTRY